MTEAAGSVEVRYLRRRLPYFVCRGHRGRVGKKEAGERNQYEEGGGPSGGRERRHGLDEVVSKWPVDHMRSARSSWGKTSWTTEIGPQDGTGQDGSSTPLC